MVPHLRLRMSVGSLLFVGSTLVSATAPRTFVASMGTDNPSCSIAAPCRSFAAAIAATNSGGEIIVQDSAGYGTVTITKSISIIAPPGIYAGITVLSGNGITINAPGEIVVLRGLSINGQGGANGILSQAAARVRVENCIVSGMGAVGIYHAADNGEMIVVDTISRDNGDGGFALVAKYASIVLDHARSEHNFNVGFYMAPVVPSTYANATITESTFVSNGYGIWADSVGGALTFILVERSVFSGNGQNGFRATAGAGGAAVNATLTRNAFARNGIYAIYSLGGAAAVVNSWISENTFLGGGLVLADGAGSNMSVGGNTGQAYLRCDNGATMTSSGTNFGGFVSVLSCTFSNIGGY